jgi:hypothetical protein
MFYAVTPRPCAWDELVLYKNQILVEVPVGSRLKIWFIVREREKLIMKNEIVMFGSDESNMCNWTIMLPSGRNTV